MGWPNKTTFDSRTSISTTEFTGLYTYHGTIEKVCRYLKGINFKGLVNIPVGTFTFTSSSVLKNLDTTGIYLRGDSKTTTIINMPDEIYNCNLQIGLARLVSVPIIWLSKIIHMDGSTPAACVWAGRVTLNQSLMEADSSTFEDGLYVTYASNAHIDKARIWCSSADSIALLVDQASYVSWEGNGGVISNPNAYAGSVGVVVGTGSTVLGDLGSKIGAIGQTIDTGVSVARDSRYIGPPTFVGTVTTQYSQTVNVRTNDGIIFA